MLSSLLFALVMDEETKNIREGVVKKILYADDFGVLSWEEVEYRYLL